VDVLRLFARGRMPPGGRLVLATWFCGLLLVRASGAAEPSPAPGESPTRHLAADGLYKQGGSAAEIVKDVIVSSGGLLRGRVVDASGSRLPSDAAGLRVKLLRGRETVAVTVTNRQGEFALQNICGGLYLLVVDGRGLPSCRFYRVWTSPAAPPQAPSEMNVPIGGPVLRGQYPTPFPITSLRQAAIVTGIGAGAIAAPVIYYNTQLDNRVPRSP
jgi:hypothetical protein